MLSAAAVMTSCYNKFEDVEPTVVYDSREAFEKAFPGCEYKTIEELKQIYADRTNDPDFTGGENTGWSNTKYWQFGSNEGLYGAEDYYFRGKVVSNDEQGNIYKSLYLLDETGAIEVRLTSGNYLKYYMGEWNGQYPVEIPSTYVYVRVKDLYIGNYRMMLSIGAGPTDSFNKRDEHKFYANSAIDSPAVIAEHVFVGESTTLKEGVDIPVVDETNYSSINGQGGRQMFGRLILFKGLTCTYAGVADQYGNTSNGIGDNIYPSWLYTENLQFNNGILSKPWYDWAYSVKGKCLYGSVLFSYASEIPSSGMNAGSFSLRTSGYSRFAARPTLKNGAKGDLLAIYSIYSKSWTYSYGAYQLAVSRVQDILFSEDDYLTSEVVSAMTPDGGNGIYRISDSTVKEFLAYDMTDSKLVTISREAETTANVVRPTFLTRYQDGEFDKFVNYPSYGATNSALLFAAGDKNLVLKVGDDGAILAEEVALDGKFLDYNAAYEFVLTKVGDKNDYFYTLMHGDKYLASVGGVPTLTDAYTEWRITIPVDEYNSNNDATYVPWVGEEDDEAGGLD